MITGTRTKSSEGEVLDAAACGSSKFTSGHIVQMSSGGKGFCPHLPVFSAWFRTVPSSPSGWGTLPKKGSSSPQLHFPGRHRGSAASGSAGRLILLLPQPDPSGNLNVNHSVLSQTQNRNDLFLNLSSIPLSASRREPTAMNDKDD